MRILTDIPIFVQPLNGKKRKRGKVLETIRAGRVVITLRQSKSGEKFLLIEEPP